jgi:hypothetical protein
MDADELRAILDRMGWSQGDLARNAQRDPARTRKMARGQEPIDEPLANWLRKVAPIISDPPLRPGNHRGRGEDIDGSEPIPTTQTSRR